MSYAPPMLFSAIDAVKDGVLILGRDRSIIACNRTFTHITGYEATVAIGQPFDFNTGPATDPHVLAAVERAFENAEIFTGEIRQYKQDGETFWNDLSIVPNADAAGNLSHFVAIVRDVTAAKATQDALIACVERQVFLLDRIQAGIVIHGASSEIIYANAAATKLLGVPLNGERCDGEHGAHWAFVREDGSPMPPEDYPANRAARKNLVRNHLVGVRNPRTCKFTWLMCNAYPTRDVDGSVTEVIVSFADVTELKLAERALQKSEERLRLVLEGSRDAPWDWDLVADDCYYSPRWWEMIGYAPGERQCDSRMWVDLIHPDDRARALGRLETALHDRVTSYEMEFRLRCKNGSYVPVLSRGFILRDNAGRPMRISGTNTDLTERKIAEARINQLAFFDSLTELPNRRALIEQLHRALHASARDRRQGALLFIDLDNFKVLNDTLGHDEGDRLLAQVAKRLRDCVRESDTVARLGGDEFVVMLEGLPRDERDAAFEAEGVGKKILATLDQPYVIAGREHLTTASIGIALFADGKGGVERVLKQADLAMYEAKAVGRNTLRNFDMSMQRAVDERLALEQDLRKALQLGETLPYFQPQVFEGGNVIGAEVLMRWLHPTRGLVRPTAFIPLAETTGLIVPLGRSILRQACMQLAAWAKQPRLNLLSLSVNVSVRQFREPGFIADVIDILAETGADPAKLKLEITESLLADNIDDIGSRMGRLKASGVSFSLDDFGTGYSSLRYLQRLPLDELKIDRTFVHDAPDNPNDATIALAIITLADKLGLGVIAEGVANHEQRHFLSRNGCRAYQGYLFGKPMPLADFESAALVPSTGKG